LQKTTHLLVHGLLIAAAACALAADPLASLVPLDDTQPDDPLVPIGVSHQQPDCFGHFVYLWTLQDQTRVVQFHGDFSLHLGDRRLNSDDAVIWMQRTSWEGSAYYHFEIFLSGNARVRETGGTMTTGPVLFVTFNTIDPVRVFDDVHTLASSAQSKLYVEADRVRKTMLSGGVEAEAGPDMRVVDFTTPRKAAAVKPRPIVRHRADEEIYDEKTGTITATGEVYVAQGAIDSAEFLEIRADAAVMFIAETKEPDAERRSGPRTRPTTDTAPFPTDSSEPESPRSSDTFGFDETMRAAVAGAYLQGDVVLTRGERLIRASELYYDFENDRALILDAVMRAMAPERNIPIYVRAAKVRQLSRTEYTAQKAMISSSEFHTPHVHLGAENVRLTDATPRDEAGRITGVQAGQFEIQNATLNVEGVPVMYWPYAAGNFQRSETSIRSVRFAYGDDFGATFQAKWYLFNLLGLEEPDGVESLLRTDIFGQRGPGIGVDSDYELEDSYGLLRTYYIQDQGEDNLGPFRSGPPENEDRGRFTWRHREILPDDWELTLEASYISDPTFLEEYFNAEFEEGKEQETLVYLKKQKDNWAFTLLGQWRILDFLTQTEHLPDAAFYLIGEPLGDLANLYSETHAGFARYRPDNRRLFNRNRFIDNTGTSDIVARTETRNEIDVPIRLGNANIVPFVTGRYGYWDDSPFAGGLDRVHGTAGVRAGTQLWRLFEDVNSTLFDVNGVRHIIKPEMTTWYSASNRRSLDLHPFDEGIEDIDDFYGTSLALRQRWQTKRGGPGEWRVVDWIVFDVEANFFGHAPTRLDEIGRFCEYRPENSIARSHITTDFLYRISDTTVLLSDGNFDLNDGNLDVFNLSYAVERSPRFSYFLGYRRIGDTDSDLIGSGANYRINTKHTVAIRAYYDLERGEAEQIDLTLIRKFPRWYAGLTFGLDNIENDVHVGVSIWPEGAPQAAIGSRKYTGLAQSTGIRPED